MCASLLSCHNDCQGDPQLDPTGTGTKTLPFVRSAFVRSTDGKDTREHVNFITHFLDASQVLSTMTTLCRLGTVMMVCVSDLFRDLGLKLL